VADSCRWIHLTRIAFDPLAPETINDPYRMYERLRIDPTHWHEPLNAWILTRYEDCLSVLRAPEHFASDLRRVGLPIPATAVSIQSLDPPEHTTVRRLLAAGLRAQDMDALEQATVRRTEKMLDSLVDVGDFDFVSEFASPLALATICQVVGIDPPERRSFAKISEAIVRSMDSGLVPEAASPGMDARAALDAMIRWWSRNGRRDGLLSYMLGHHVEAEVPNSVVLNTVRVVLHAGYDSVVRLLSNALLALLRHPPALGAAASAGLSSTAVEELVRYDGPVQATSRTCVHDLEFGRRRLRQGHDVVLLFGAANRDPERIDAPHELLLERSPIPHLGFGAGIHACAGAQLAKMLCRIALTALTARHPAVRLAGDPVHSPTATMRGPNRLPVRLVPT
jgi:cytochrome P450